MHAETGKRQIEISVIVKISPLCAVIGCLLALVLRGVMSMNLSPSFLKR